MKTPIITPFSKEYQSQIVFNERPQKIHRTVSQPPRNARGNIGEPTSSLEAQEKRWRLMRSSI